MQRDIIFWIWLADLLGPKNGDFRRLMHVYESAYNLFHTDIAEIERIPELSRRTREKLMSRDLSRASQILEECMRKEIGILSWGDIAYPTRLREVREPPIVLYYRGMLPDFNNRLCIGMVGTRNMSMYGMRMAYRFAYELASAKALVVSGMAAGIDGVSAAAAMIAGGDTVAVLGCGVDVTYPSFHKKLKDEIEQHGAVISEYPPGTRPNHYQFPARNRIISGLCESTLVVEAGYRSGSLITAKDAIMQGRQVFAVPANLEGSGAQGTNGLLKDGAYMALCTKDILINSPLHFNVIDMDVLDVIGTQSRLNMRALEQYGVIELIKKSETAPNAQPTEVYTAPTPTRKAKKEKEQKTAEETAPEPAPRKVSEETVKNLTPIQLAIMQAIPDDRPVPADALGQLGYPFGDVMSTLTMLEILGLIRKLPGSLYTKI